MHFKRHRTLPLERDIVNHENSVLQTDLAEMQYAMKTAWTVDSSIDYSEY